MFKGRGGNILSKTGRGLHSVVYALKTGKLHKDLPSITISF